MVLLLNLIPVIIVIAVVWWARKRVAKQTEQTAKLKAVIAPVIVLVASLGLYTNVQPSYLPKGEIKRTVPPAFEQKESQIQDISLKPVSSEERDKIRKEQYQEKLPFLNEKSAQ